MSDSKMYGIVGNGRMARHMMHYFDSLGVSYAVWHRKSDVTLEQAFGDVDACLVLVRDDAIEDVITHHAFLRSKPCVHFSGSVVTSFAQGMHPLSNFPDAMHSSEVYPTIPFVVEAGEFSFLDIFPMLPNPSYEITSDMRSKYHALCVIIGNFPTMLWLEARNEFKTMGLPEDLFHVYLQNIVKQYIDDPDHALTGPFARKDQATIEANQNALDGSKLQKIYAAFQRVFSVNNKK